MLERLLALYQEDSATQLSIGKRFAVADDLIRVVIPIFWPMAQLLLARCGGISAKL